MNKSQMFTGLLYQTITDICIWQDVLAYACKMTNATKGIVALRSKRNAELIISEKLHIQRKSPMLYGFSSEEIKSYITNYYKCDPWRNVAKKHHPSISYAMSEYISIQELKSSQFWMWLEPQGISDSVILDIYDVEENWVSVNLFFDHNDECVRHSSLALLHNFQMIMKDVWRLGLQFRRSHTLPQSVIYFLERENSASIIIDQDLQILYTNHKADLILLDSKNMIVKVSNSLLIRDKEKHKHLKEFVIRLSKKMFNLKAPEHRPIQFDNWMCTGNLLSESQNVIGENTANFLLTIRSKVIPTTLQCIPIWEDSRLTRRERELVKVLAEGGMIVDFQNEYGIAKSTAHAHWSNAKKKLNIMDRAQIFAKHQIFLQN